MPEGPSLDMVGDGSSSGQPALRRCDNPWKPNAQHGQSEVKTEDLRLFVHIYRSSYELHPAFIELDFSN